jgi:uncharacterized protein (DUF305 family)
MSNSIRLIVAMSGAGVVLAASLTFGLSLGLSQDLAHSMMPAHHHAGAAPSDAATGETGTTFYTEMAAVNARMHEAMAVAPTGDPDRDFARMMIPHHQGAIDMALVLLKYGHDEKLRRLAQSIIVEQGQEIAYMRMLLGGPTADPSAAPHAAHQ